MEGRRYQGSGRIPHRTRTTEQTQEIVVERSDFGQIQQNNLSLFPFGFTMSISIKPSFRREWLMLMYNNIRKISMVAYALIYAANTFLQIPILGSISQILLLLAVLLTLPALAKTNRIVSVSLIVIAFVILISTGIPIKFWLEAFSRNAGLAALFITIPMLNIPFGYGNYQDELKRFAMKYLRSPWTFCMLVWILTHLFGVIILIGSIPLVFQLFYENSKLYNAEKQFTSALIHGQISGGFWSPVWSSMVIITYTLDIPWLRFIPIGLFLTLIFFICSMAWIYVSLKRSDAHRIEGEVGLQTNWHEIIMIVVLTVLPILLIVVLNYVSDISVTSVIPVVSLGYPILMALLMNKWKRYGNGMSDYYNVRILNVKNEVALLTAAGFFGKTLELAGIQSAVMYLLPNNVAEYPFFAIVSIMMVFVITVHMGLHPVVAGSALVVSIAPEALGLTPFMFGFTLIAGWSIGILLSPFSATNMVTGGLTKHPSWYLSTRMHGIFGFSMLLLISGVLALLSNYY
ncbi:MAG TPA: hypothetical protein DEZ27_12305 [Sphaerochaeta sp.]|nr:hypothetical protein [Sphaerochaeta sp.]